MFDKSAIEALSEAAAIDQAVDSIQLALSATRGAAALPVEFKIHDLESFMAARRRARGTMETSSIADFAAYVTQHHEPGASVFVSPNAMVANAVLNLGDPDAPGHADNRAQFKPRMTAAYMALSQVSQGQALEQQRVAEFLEDWGHAIECFHDSERLQINKAIAAVRNITIDALRKVEASEQQGHAAHVHLLQVRPVPRVRRTHIRDAPGHPHNRQASNHAAHHQSRAARRGHGRRTARQGCRSRHCHCSGAGGRLHRQVLTQHRGSGQVSFQLRFAHEVTSPSSSMTTALASSVGCIGSKTGRSAGKS